MLELFYGSEKSERSGEVRCSLLEKVWHHRKTKRTLARVILEPACVDLKNLQFRLSVSP